MGKETSLGKSPRRRRRSVQKGVQLFLEKSAFLVGKRERERGISAKRVGLVLRS